MWRRVCRCFSVQQKVTDQLFDVLLKFEKVDPAALTPQATYAELGLDSVDVVETIAALEGLLGVDLDEEDALALRSVSDTIALFTKHCSEDSNSTAE